MILRDRTGGESTDEHVYIQQDANLNVTSLTDTSGNMVQRDQYNPYGGQTVLNDDWNATTDAYGFLVGFQGGFCDATTGVYTFQRRDYDPTLGRWIEQDPNPAGQYADGMNLYQMEGSSPVDRVDPSGNLTDRQKFVIEVGMTAGGAAIGAGLGFVLGGVGAFEGAYVGARVGGFFGGLIGFGGAVIINDVQTTPSVPFPPPYIPPPPTFPPPPTPPPVPPPPHPPGGPSKPPGPPGETPGSGPTTCPPTTQPTTQPTTGPTTEPTTQPTTEPATQPTTRPTTQPTTQPTSQPSGGNSLEPGAKPWWQRCIDWVKERYRKVGIPM